MMIRASHRLRRRQIAQWWVITTPDAKSQESESTNGTERHGDERRGITKETDGHVTEADIGDGVDRDKVGDRGDIEDKRVCGWVAGWHGAGEGGRFARKTGVSAWMRTWQIPRRWQGET